MSVYAPESPSLAELQARYPIDEAIHTQVAAARIKTAEIAIQTRPGLIAILGPCAMTAAREIICDEGEQLAAAEQNNVGLVTTHRVPMWKPRSDPSDWHELETTDPELAYAILAGEVSNGSNLSIEIGHTPHLDRYGKLTVLNRFGGRNILRSDIMDEVATADPMLPLGVKNGLDGNIFPALRRVAGIGQLRAAEGAPAVLIYRGGANASNPQEWEKEYRSALLVTGGRMIVDIAHGTEMAHDPDGKFAKSVGGQILALEHVIKIAESGELPIGIMAEASDAESPTDPNMPFQIALDGVVELNGIRLSEMRRSSPVPRNIPTHSGDPWSTLGQGGGL